MRGNESEDELKRENEEAERLLHPNVDKEVKEKAAPQRDTKEGYCVFPPTMLSSFVELLLIHLFFLIHTRHWN